MEKFIFPFLLSFILTILFIFFLIPLAGKFHWPERKGRRHFPERKKTLRIGGLAIILAFFLTVLFDRNLFLSWEIKGLLLTSGLILIFGIWDDLKELSWKTQLFFQISITLLIFFWGIRIEYLTNPLSQEIINFSSNLEMGISFFLVLFWILILVNSLNWLDGIDGLSGGTALIVAATIFILSLKPEVNQPPVAILAAALVGGILGFLLFNFYPAKILAGTSGAMFFGFSLSVLAIFSGTKVATAILVLFLPLADFLWVIRERFREKKSIFQADQRHLHYKLLELGWSPRKINLLFFSVSLALAVIALNTRALGKSIAFIIFGSLMIVFLFFIRKKTD